VSELFEFLLNIVLEFVWDGLDAWAGWRFFLPVLSSLAIVGLIDGVVSNSGARIGLSAPVLLVGVSVGIFWQVRGDQSR
jgi:hypothetical protein